MKKAVSILTLSVVLFACGGDKEKTVEEVIASSNLTEIRAKKEAISVLHTSYEEQLELLNAKITTLDTNKKIAFLHMG